MAESTLSVLCSRGCGTPLEVEQQMVTNMVTLGQPLVFQHAEGQCPNELAAAAAGIEHPMRRFRLQILAYEIGDPEPDVATGAYAVEVPGTELIGGLGHTVEARNYPEAVNGPMTEWLAVGWAKFQENAGWAEVPAAPPPAPKSAPERRTGPGGAVLL